MIAVIGGSENAASARLHKAAGFAEAGQLKDVGFRRVWFSIVIMQRAIGPGSGTMPDR